LEDYKHVKTFMEEHFYNAEPLCTFAGEDASKRFQQFFQDYHISMIKEGTCLVAINEKDGESVAAVALAGSSVPSHLEEQRKMSFDMDQCSLKPIMIFVSEVELKANVFKHYGASKLLYSSVTNVDASMRGRGLGTRLAAALMELGRSKGFHLLSATCTSFYSARQMEAMGMECVYSEAYADYKDDNGQVILKLPSPHTHIRVLAIKL